jgi:hypothetical protein
VRESTSGTTISRLFQKTSALNRSSSGRVQRSGSPPPELPNTAFESKPCAAGREGHLGNFHPLPAFLVPGTCQTDNCSTMRPDNAAATRQPNEACKPCARCQRVPLILFSFSGGTIETPASAASAAVWFSVLTAGSGKPAQKTRHPRSTPAHVDAEGFA